MLEISLEPIAADRLPQLSQCFGLQLPHSFAGEVELLPYLLQSAHVAVCKAESPFDDNFLVIAKSAQQTDNHALALALQSARLRIRTRDIHHSLDQLGSPLRVHRLVKGYDDFRCRQQFRHSLPWNAGLLRQFRESRLVATLAHNGALDPAQFTNVLQHIARQSY